MLGAVAGGPHQSDPSSRVTAASAHAAHPRQPSGPPHQKLRVVARRARDHAALHSDRRKLAEPDRVYPGHHCRPGFEWTASTEPRGDHHLARGRCSGMESQSNTVRVGRKKARTTKPQPGTATRLGRFMRLHHTPDPKDPGCLSNVHKQATWPTSQRPRARPALACPRETSSPTRRR